jgi:hypothetical protein
MRGSVSDAEQRYAAWLAEERGITPDEALTHARRARVDLGEPPIAKPAASPTLYCSFCGKGQHEVRRMIAGPSVFICDECVEACQAVVDEH